MLKPLIEEMVLTSLHEMKGDFGEKKKEYVEAIIGSKEAENWNNFLSEISEPFLLTISKPTKILPSNQYEDQLKQLNNILNDKEAYSKLLCSLESLNILVIVPKHIPGMVLFRLCSKLIDKLCQFVFREMREHKLTNETDETSSEKMSDIEREAFLIHVRKLLQEYYKRGLRNGSKHWLSRCACIRQKFIRSNDLCEAPSVNMLLDNESWEQDNQGNVKLHLSEMCVYFFSEVEEIIESLIKTKENYIDCDKVIDVALRSVEILDAWCSLTMLFFTEVEAIVFMRDMISVLLNLSLRLEVGRMRENIGRVKKYALRTDLKRN